MVKPRTPLAGSRARPAPSTRHLAVRSLQTAPPVASPDSHPAVVLVVDDEHLIRWSIRTHLRRAGYRVEIAETGDEALRRFGNDVDLVLLDVRLPDRDGLEVLVEMKRRRAGCRIILMTAYDCPDLASEALDRGAERVLNKPFDLDVMAAAVGDALGGPGSERLAGEAPH